MLPATSPVHARAADPIALHVLVVGHDGRPLPAFSHDFAASDLAAIGADVVNQGYGDGVHDFGSYTGVSIRRLVTTQLAIPVDSVETATFDCTAVVGPERFSGAAGDFTDPVLAGDTYPFQDNLPPVFATGSTGDPNAFEFVVDARKPDHRDDSLTSGADGTASAGRPMTLTLQLQDKVLAPTLVADPESATVGQPVTFTAHVTDPDPTETLHWTWTFGDGGTDDTLTSPSATSTYTNPAGGDFPVTARLTGDHGSSGVATVTVHVAGTTTPPPTPATPPAGTSHGPGGSDAPTVGPRSGDGPRQGGVATGRPGHGSAGASYAPHSPGATAAPTATGADAQADGAVVGYLLSDATAAAVPREAAPKAVDDSSPAARNGDSSLAVGGGLLGGGAVVALLCLGALSERRRPTHARRHPTSSKRER